MLRKRILAVCTASTLALGVAGAPAAQAQQEGLVNVFVNDVLDVNNNNIGVGVAAGVAAQVCGLTAQVGVIARQVARTGTFECRNAANGQTARIEQAQ